MDGIKSTALSPFMGLPDELICNIVSFCNTSTGRELRRTCKRLRHLLFEELRKVQIVLISRVAEGIDKIGVLNHRSRGCIIACKEEAVREIEAALTTTDIARISGCFAGKITRFSLREPGVVCLHPFASSVGGHIKEGYHFIPPYLEKRVCQAMIDINAFYFSDSARLEEVLTLMRKGELDQTEESTKVEADGKSCLLAGLGKAAIRLGVMKRPLFFDILARIEQKEAQAEFLLFCLKNNTRYFVKDDEIFNFLIDETFFSSLPPQTQEEFIEEFHKSDPLKPIVLSLYSADRAVKKKALELQMKEGQKRIHQLNQ